MTSINPKCKRCSLHAGANTVCLAGEGSEHADVMFVGEAPGAEEDQRGRPFIGKSGQLLRREIERNGLGEVYISNVVKCRPEANRQPTPQEIKACKEYLFEEIERVRPKFVVALGATATKTLFPGRSKVTQYHGTIIDDPKKPYRGYIAYHPAYTLRDPTKLPALRQDLARLARAVRGETRAPEAAWSLVRRGNLQKFLREFAAAPEFSFDLETSGYFMHAPGGYINAVSIDLPTRTWVIPLMDYDPINQRRKYTPWRRGDAFKRLIETLARIQKDTEKRCVGHNGKFDNLWLLRITGVRFKLTFDTMLASHLLDENREHDLKSLARTILDVPEYDVSKKEKMGVVQPRALYRYSAYDAYYTRRLKKFFLRDLRADPWLLRLFYRLVMPGARAMEMVEMVGLYMNLEKMDDLTLSLQSELIEEERVLNKLAGRAINWNASRQVAEFLFGDLGLPPTLYTDKGAPSTSEEALFDLKGKHPVADKLIGFREKAKFLGTYLYGFRELMVGPVFHVSYKIHGTVGGRYSSRVHSIPRDGSIRNLVEAPPGWEFWVADISQAELRIAAHLSKDLEMRRCFTEGIDIHWRTLMFCISAGYIGTREYIEAVWDTAEKLNYSTASLADACEKLLKAGPDKCKEVNPIWKEGRYRAKAINFGFCIAEGQRVLTHVGLVPIEHVKDWHLVWDGVEWVSHRGVKFNGYQETIEYNGLKATSTHEVWTVDGRKIPFWLAASKGYRLARTGEGITPLASWDADFVVRDSTESRKVPTSHQSFLFSLWIDSRTTRRQRDFQENHWLSMSARDEIFRSTFRHLRSSVRRYGSALHERHPRIIKTLQRAWGSSTVQIQRGFHPLGFEEVPEYRLQGVGLRSERQRGALLQEQPPVDHSKYQHSKRAAMVRVYDLIDSGPRHRFTVEGILVHNCYGMGENKFIELAKTDYYWEPSFDEAHSMREGYFELYSGLPAWHEKEKKLCRLEGQNRTLTGRIRRLPAILSPDKYLRGEAERQAVNIRVQSFIGDYKTMALVEIHEQLDPNQARICGEHHDAIMGIVRNGCRDEVLPGVRAAMKSPKLLETFQVKLDIPMDSEIQVGPWGRGKTYYDPP